MLQVTTGYDRCSWAILAGLESAGRRTLALLRNSDAYTPRPRPTPKTTVSASVTVPELKRLHTLAAERRVTLSDLLRHALAQTYPDN